MAKAPGDKPASRGTASTLGTLVLAILLLAFGFWAGRTFETLWPSGGARPAATPVAGATVPPSMPNPQPSPALSPSPESSPAGSPSPEAPAEVAADPPARPAPRAGSRRAAAAGPPPAGSAPLSQPQPPVLPSRPFVLGTSVVESLKAPVPQVPGFDTGGVGVKRAPEVPGRVDFEVSPPSVRPGDSYAVRVYLVNDGGKAIAIDALSVALVADGRRSARAMPPRSKSVAPKERALLAELPGVWQDGLATWALEVAVTSKRHDRYSNTLNWK